MKIFDFKTWGIFKNKPKVPPKEDFNRDISSITPGRVSVPDDSTFMAKLMGTTQIVTP